MDVLRLVSHLWWISNVLEVALVVRLAALRLHRIYPFFIAYLILQSLGCLLAMLGGGLTSSWYCAVFWLHEPIEAILSVLTIREIFSELFSHYPGLIVLARRALLQSCAVGLVAGLLFLPVLSSVWGCPGLACKMFALVEIQRVLRTVLIAFTMLMIIRLRTIPKLILGRNLVVHVICFNSMLLASIVTGVIVFLKRNATATFLCDVGLLSTTLLCLLGWLFGMVSREAAQRPSLPHVTPEEIEAVLLRTNQLGEVCRLMYARRRFVPFGLRFF